MAVVPLNGELTDMPELRFAIPHSGMTEPEKGVARLLIEECRGMNGWVGYTMDGLVRAVVHQQDRSKRIASSRAARNQLRRERFRRRPRGMTMSDVEIRSLVERLVSPEGMCRLRLEIVDGQEVIFPTRDLLEPTR